MNKSDEKVGAYPVGIDCVWLAADRAGYLGAFVTAGSGPISRLALNARRIAIEDVEERISELPQVSRVRLLVSIPRPDDFIAIAERGIFVFDWSDVHRTSGQLIGAYEPVAVPENPIAMEDLPPDMLEYVRDIRLNEVVFGDVKNIDVRESLECLSS